MLKSFYLVTWTFWSCYDKAVIPLAEMHNSPHALKFNPFALTANLQQMTLKMSRQNIERLYKCRYINEDKSIVAKGKITRVGQFLLFAQRFQNSSDAVASKCIFKRVKMLKNVLSI